MESDPGQALTHTDTCKASAGCFPRKSDISVKTTRLFTLVLTPDSTGVVRGFHGAGGEENSSRRKLKSRKLRTIRLARLVFLSKYRERRIRATALVNPRHVDEKNDGDIIFGLISFVRFSSSSVNMGGKLPRFHFHLFLFFPSSLLVCCTSRQPGKEDEGIGKKVEGKAACRAQGHL